MQVLEFHKAALEVVVALIRAGKLPKANDADRMTDEIAEMHTKLMNYFSKIEPIRYQAGAH